ncbi:MAG TPA: AEC family transporter [Gammaproteobacteria bacterium]|nr:AEC family transporter [Gammaproteobacteria bacterium]
MAEILPRLAPIFVFFLIGVLLRRVGLAQKSDGDFVLRLAFFVTLPLLILLTLQDTELTADKIWLPIANIVVNLLCLGAMLLATRPLKLEKRVLGSMAMNTMIANNAFMFPFMLAVYGESGFADSVLFDFGNAIMVATVTYATAFRYSDEPYDRFSMLKRILKGPLFWALALGVALSVTDTSLPQGVVDVIDPLAQMTAPLILIALGIFFSLSLKQLRLVGLALFIRMGLGFVFGIGFATLVGLEGQTFVVVALCSGAPIGFTALTFASLAKLDTDLTTTAVSLSILVGLVYTPLLMLLF